MTNSASTAPGPNPGAIDLHAGNVAQFVAHRVAAPGSIVLISNADGTVQLCSHGVNHARANEMLSVGIFINLDQHYSAVRDGGAGPGAAAQMQALDARKTQPHQE